MAKKGLIYRLTMGSDNNPDFTIDKLPSNRFQVFKDVFSLRAKTLVLLNLLMVAFCLPAVAVYIYFMFLVKGKISMQTPYAGSLGVGYSAYFFADKLGDASYFYNHVFFWALMVPCLMIASLGFAGGFHTIKLLVWGEGVSFFQTFFQGIKNNFVIYLLMSFIVGVFLFLTNINLQAHLIIGTSWVTVMGSIVSIVMLVFILFMTMYLTTQAVTYKLGLFALIKNSFILTIAKIFTNILFLGLTALPIILALFIPAISSLVGIFYLVAGISLTIMVWTLYTHYVYDLFLNDRIEGAIKDRGIYRKKVEREEAEKETAKKFANPKKRKKLSSIDEGKSFTPLATSFSRADLERMEAEKEEVKQEIEHEIEVAESQLEADEPVKNENVEEAKEVNEEAKEDSKEEVNEEAKEEAKDFVANATEEKEVNKEVEENVSTTNAKTTKATQGKKTAQTTQGKKTVQASQGAKASKGEEAEEGKAVKESDGDFDVSDLEALEGVSKEALAELHKEYKQQPKPKNKKK